MKKYRDEDLILILADPLGDKANRFSAMIELRARLARKPKATPPQGIWGKLKKSRKCQWCGSRSNLTVDHIKPLARGGSDTIDNVQTLCQNCNEMKGSKFPYNKSHWQRDTSKKNK